MPVRPARASRNSLVEETKTPGASPGVVASGGCGARHCITMAGVALLSTGKEPAVTTAVGGVVWFDL